MPLDPQTSVAIGTLCTLVCIGIGCGPQLVGITRALWARYVQKRS